MRRRRLWPVVASAGMVAVAALAMAASAAAIIVQRSGPDLSYQPLNGHGPSAQALIGANMTSHGGPVVHSSAQYAIFWAPSGFAFPAGYESAIVKYLQDVAADSGKPTNVYAIATQYGDSTGPASYQASFGAAFSDANPYPASGCPLYGGFARCLTDAQLRAEMNNVIASQGLPRGLTAYYLVFLPPSVGQCTGASGTTCFDVQFCAYHSATPSPTTLYTSQPYAPVDPHGCGTGQYPNTNPVDDELSSVSHEANEIITDPLPGTGWFDTSTSGENGDLCRTGSFTSEFGPPLGGGPGTLFNQVINGGNYILQQEWSNGANGGAGGCEQRYALGGSISGPSSARAGKGVTFNGAGTDAEGGAVTGLSWSFGDGGSASGPTVAHKYLKPGAFTVTLSVSNSTGLTATATHAISVLRPSNRFSIGRAKLNKRKGTAKLPVTVPGRGSLKLAGKGLVRQHQSVKRGTVKLLVKAKGKTKQALDRKGRALVKAKVTYRPKFGLANTKAKKLKLVTNG